MGEMTGEQAERFALERRAMAVVSWASPQSVALPLEYLRQLGVVPRPVPACPAGPLEELLTHTKRVTPHVLRHTAAMLWRAKGVDIATIALLLGHESTQTTHIYEHADPALKEEAIARTAPLGTKPGRYRPSDALLAFLEDL